MKKEVQLHTFELDCLEQYSRRESIRICGIDETAGEDTEDLVQELAVDVEAGRHQRQPQTAGKTRQHTTHHREVCAEEYKDGDDEEQEEAA